MPGLTPYLPGLRIPSQGSWRRAGFSNRALGRPHAPWCFVLLVQGNLITVILTIGEALIRRTEIELGECRIMVHEEYIVIQKTGANDFWHPPDQTFDRCSHDSRPFAL